MEADSSRCQCFPVWKSSFYHFCLQEDGSEKCRLIPPPSLVLPSGPNPVPPGASGNIPGRNTLEVGQVFPPYNSLIVLTSTHIFGVHWEPAELTQTISRLDV